MPKHVGWRMTKVLEHRTVAGSGAQTVQEKGGRTWFVHPGKEELLGGI